MPDILNTNGCRAIAFVNNAISLRLLDLALERDGVARSEVVLICGRQIVVEAKDEFLSVLEYGRKPSLKAIGQYKVLGFFIRGASIIRKALKSTGLQEIYIVNNDNLLTSHILNWAKLNFEKRVRISVLAEGIMNYQDIGLDDRASWRWLVKPVLAKILRLNYTQPTTHLSGSFESEVSRVISFTEHGLKSPSQKIVVLKFPIKFGIAKVDHSELLILHTGLWQWMAADKYLSLAQMFAAWVVKGKFNRIAAKPHPHISTGVIEGLLPPHELVTVKAGVEHMAEFITAGTVVGTCCTALATLKIMRPDLRCVDYGSLYYCEHAYHGDQSVRTLLSSVGVELIEFGE